MQVNSINVHTVGTKFKHWIPNPRTENL